MINFVIFNGGRGARTLLKALSQIKGANITSVVNAYDDGKSTGELRYFFKMLGPSDIRKVQEVLISEDHPDYEAIIELYKFRYGKNVSKKDVWTDFKSFIDRKKNEIVGIKLKDSQLLDSLRVILSVLLKGLEIVEKAENKIFNYKDCSIMNLIYAGTFLYFKGNFEEATIFLDKLFKLKGTVLPTNIEDKKLVAIREDGTVLYDEAQIVEIRSNSRIKRIYLLDQYPDPKLLSKMPLNEVEVFFDIMSRQVSVTPRVDRGIRNADVIIYAPGTQHSSLYPSYMSKGLTEAIVDNRGALKVFITNIGEDYETPQYTASDFINGGIKYLRMGAEFNVSVPDLITYALVNNEFSGNLENYVKYNQAELDKIGCKILLDRFEDLRNPGKHDGQKLVETIINLYSKYLKL